MLKIGFTDEMLNTLATMKGKTFKSYECQKEADGNLDMAFGILRINLGRSAIDLKCELELVEDFIGGPDEVATFSCKEVNLKSTLVPYFGMRTVVYMVDEIIKSVEIVRDHVVNRNTVNGEICVFDIDVALVISTKYHVFAFSIDECFYEEITISITDSESIDLDIAPTNELWVGAEDLTVEASREFLQL